TNGPESAADIAEQPDVLAGVIDRNRPAIENAAELIAGRALVRLAGIGSSRHAAGYGSIALELLADIPATVLPAPGAAIAQPRLRSDHPLILLSQSGATPALLDLARDAASARVPTV